MSDAVIRAGAPLAGRSDTENRAVYAVAAISALLLALMLPFVPWIRVVNTEALFEAMSLKASAVKKLGNSYPVYTFLGFVQDSKQGALGLWSFVLLLVAAATAVFHVWGLVLFALRRRLGEKGGLLGMYGRLLGGMVFSLALSLGTIGLTAFANMNYGMTGFVPGIAVYATPILAILGYVLGKRLQREERVLRREHGFVEEFRRNWLLFLFLVPCFVFFLINNYLPMVGIYFAFTQFNFKDSLFASPYVGFKNFEFLMKSEIVHLTMNTILYNIVFIVLGNVLQVLFAILVSQVTHRRVKKLSQTMIFMPYFVSYVILRVLVFNMFEYDVGLINNFLTAMGRAKIDFYNTPSYWPWIITLFYLWKNVGYGMVVYLATITGISSDYYEAAQMDGANIFQQIRYITVPLLKPTFIILLLYALGGIMKGQFELFYQLVGNNGTLFATTDIFDTYVYRITTTQPLSMGMGTAAGLFQSLFGFILIVGTNFFIKRKNPEYALF